MKLIVVLQVIGIAIACQHILNCHECVLKRCQFKLLLSGESKCVKSLGQTTGVMGVASSLNHCQVLEGLIKVVKEIAYEKQMQAAPITTTEKIKTTSLPSTTQPSTEPTTQQSIPYIPPTLPTTTEQSTTKLATETSAVSSSTVEYTTRQSLTQRNSVTFIQPINTNEKKSDSIYDFTTLPRNDDEPTTPTTQLYWESTIPNTEPVTVLNEEASTMHSSDMPNTEPTSASSVDEQQINRLDKINANSTAPNKSIAEIHRARDKRVRMRYTKYSNVSFFNVIPKTRFCTSTPTNVEKYVGILCQIEKFKFIAGRDTLPEKEYIYLMLNEARYYPKTCRIVKRRKRCIKRKLPTRGPKGWGATYPRASILYDALSQTLKRDCSKFARKETNLESLARLLCQLVESGKRINTIEFSEQAYGYYLFNPALNYGDVCETLFYRKRYCVHKYFI